MKRVLFSVFCLSSSISLQAQPRPKLVIGIVVDQMRWDYLYRYFDHYGDDGFKRLIHNGFSCEQTFINYLPAFTAPGHTCIYTGSVPAIHGIAGNDWIEDGRYVYCTDDKTASPIGGSQKWGQMSPHNLLTTTIGDELKLATNGRSRVFGISLKDRSAILPAGHLADAAYWFDDSTGAFSTSSYYYRGNKPLDDGADYDLPKWVNHFNDYHWADTILSKDWNLFADPTTYTQSIQRNRRYEGAFDSSETDDSFTHKARFFMSKGAMKYNNVRYVPAGNSLTMRFAKRCIQAENLGRKGDPDMLCLSLSATDYAGHKFGPNSVELEDMYIRLDAELARFLRFLDEQVGANNYTVFLTADHGVAYNSLFLEDNQIPAGNISEAAWLKELNDYLKKSLDVDSAVLSLDNYQVSFNPHPTATSGKFSFQYINGYTQNWLKARREVAFVMDMAEIGIEYYVPEPIRTMAINGYYAPRSGKLQIILKPGYYMGYAPTGATHGTWNPYDTHIPLLWYGWGIPKGKTNRELHMTDIAATLAALLHIQMPNGCVGKVITEIVP